MKQTAFLREKNGECAAIFSTYLLTKYIKYNVWRLAVRYVIYIYYISRLRVKGYVQYS
jgi:hypothetical protein